MSKFRNLISVLVGLLQLQPGAIRDDKRLMLLAAAADAGTSTMI